MDIKIIGCKTKDEWIEAINCISHCENTRNVWTIPVSQADNCIIAYYRLHFGKTIITIEKLKIDNCDGCGISFNDVYYEGIRNGHYLCGSCLMNYDLKARSEKC